MRYWHKQTWLWKPYLRSLSQKPMHWSMLRWRHYRRVLGKKNLEFEHTTMSGCSGGRGRLIDWYQMSANSVKWPKEMRPTKHEWLRKLRDTLATTSREAAKHCPVALAAQLKNYNSENEARNINSLFSTDGWPSQERNWNVLERDLNEGCQPQW